MNQLKFKNIFSIIDNYEVLLFDIWGVIVEGDIIYPGVVEAINILSQEKQVYFVSNSPRPVRILYDKLQAWDIDTSIDKVICSGEIARKFLETVPNPVIYHLGQDRNQDILASTTYKITDDIEKANIFLLTLFCDEGEDISEYDQLLKIVATKKITNICANPDIMIPNAGIKRYGPGYFARKIEEFGGKVIYTGKPHMTIYEAVFKKMPHIAKNQILMIGDTFETDILGASRAGIHSALVLTGNCSEIHKQYDNIDKKLQALQEAAKKYNVVPNYVTEISVT